MKLEITSPFKEKEEVVANPYALFLNDECTEVVYMQEYSPEEIEETLNKHVYDYYVVVNDYGRPIMVGDVRHEDRFAPPKPFPSWKLHPEADFWEAPVPHPDFITPQTDFAKFKVYSWDEDSLSWVLSSIEDCRN